MSIDNGYSYQVSGGRKSRTESAVDSIEAMVRVNSWTDGQKLPSQRELAERLGFSRPTIREALVAMETMGKVSILPGKGVFLAGDNTMSPAAVHSLRSERAPLSGRESQMYQFRYAIEPAIAGLVAQNATAAQIADMEVLTGGMRTAMEVEDHVQFARLDFSFHSQLIEAANNLFFTEAITPFLGLFFESQKLPLDHFEGVRDTVAEHEELLDHIKNRRLVEARLAMERHIMGVASRAGIRVLV